MRQYRAKKASPAKKAEQNTYIRQYRASKRCTMLTEIENEITGNQIKDVEILISKLLSGENVG